MLAHLEDDTAVPNNHLAADWLGLLACAGASYGVYHFSRVPADGHFVDPAFAPPLAESAGRVVVYVAGEPILKAIEEQKRSGIMLGAALLKLGLVRHVSRHGECRDARSVEHAHDGPEHHEQHHEQRV